MGGSSSTTQALTPTTTNTDNSNVGNIGSGGTALGANNFNLSGASGGSLTITQESPTALAAAAGIAAQGIQAAQTAAGQEAQVASGALQFSSGLSTQGANLAGSSNFGGQIKQFIVPIAIILGIVVIVYFIAR